MSISKFIRKLFIKIISFVIILVFLCTGMSALNIVVSNQIALDQFENSNELFLFSEVYKNAILPAASILVVVSCIVFIFSIVTDVIKFIKSKDGKDVSKNEND